MPKKPVDIDKMLAESEQGRGPRNLKEQNQMQQGLTRPKEGGVYTSPEGSRAGQIKTKDYAPADISPHGDLGMLDDKEQKAFFPKPIKGANAEWRSSKHFPMGKVRTAADYDVMKPRMDACSPVYPEYHLPDHSGVKAGSMVGGHGKNARGVAATVSQPAAVKQKGNSKSPIVNKRVKNV